MILLLTNARIYAPESLGLCDILIAGHRIEEIQQVETSKLRSLGVRSMDCHGAIIVPGYIDIHEHVIGGGGEQGFSSRVPEINLSEITTAGVTTVLGMLGTDGLTRSIEALYAKVCALNDEGITAYLLTGSYRVPSVTITGSVEKDIVFLDKAVGVKLAMSDHRSSNITMQDLITTASDARLGGMISGKAGITVIHMGTGKDRLHRITEALKESDLPIEKILPTHVGRSKQLLTEAISYAKQGGNIDFTADEEDEDTTLLAIREALTQQVPIERMTLSSDSCGSIPRFDTSGNCIGMTYTLPRVLHQEIIKLVNNYHYPLDLVLKFVTVNAAKRIGLEQRKGQIKEGMDADLIVYDCDMAVHHVMAMGRWMVLEKKPIVKGKFEE